MINSKFSDNKYLPVYLASFAFILLNSLLIAGEIYYLIALPYLIILAGLAFFSLDKLLLITVFLVPFSLELSYIAGKNLSLDISLPTEPLLIGITLLLIIKLFRKQLIDKRILSHPVSLAIYFHLAWIFVTSITSTMPLVSFKFMIARIWFILPFYFLAAQMFQDSGKIWRYIRTAFIPYIFIIAYVLFRHSQYGFTDQQASHFVVRPFFNDHTSYGAVLAMVLPVLFGLYHACALKKIALKKNLFIILIIYFITALVFSYTRAAWVSLIAAFLIWLIIKLRIPWSIILAGALIAIFAIFSYSSEIIMKLEKNKQTSSGNFSEHIQSIANITHDNSNLERINRWNCALRMFKEKPFFGWGPGTYMFQYAPFQLSGEKTLISTNAGTAGNAHSEYLGPLSESGILGAVSIILIILLTIRTGLKVYFQVERRKTKIMSLAILLGLITYYVHGLLNNYLDTDKASVLFWGFTAMLVAMEVFHMKKKPEPGSQFPVN